MSDKGEMAMGYVLPVDRYTYMNYQERQRTNPTSISAVNPSFRVVLEREQQEVISLYKRSTPSLEKMLRLQPRRTEDVDRTYAEITGKGKIINKII